MKDTHDTHMDDVRVERIRTSDGRYGEKHVRNRVDTVPCSGDFEAESVVEVWEEDRPLQLKERVREVKRPCVVERVIETIDNGEVVERRVEAIDDVSRPLRMVDHIGVARPEVSVQEAEDCDCVSREELEGHIATMVDGLKDALASEDDFDYDVYEDDSDNEYIEHRAQAVVEDNVEESGSFGVIEWVLLGVIGVEAAYLVMNVLPQYMNRF